MRNNRINPFSGFKHLQISSLFSISAQELKRGFFYGLLFFALPAMFSFSFSGTNVVKKDALCSEITRACHLGENGQMRMVFSYHDKDYSENRDLISEIDKTLVFTNFTRFLPFMNFYDNGGSALSFSMTIGENERSIGSSFSAITLPTFSNNEKFECLNLELVNKKEEPNLSNPQGCSGFIYLPDFLADQIIEQGIGFSKYDDFFDSQAIISLHPDGSSAIYSYAVANIFHVTGFSYSVGESEAYYASDNNNGSLMRKFLGNFVILKEMGDFALHSSFFQKLSVIFDGGRFVTDQLFSETLGNMQKDAVDVSLSFLSSNVEVPFLPSVQPSSLYSQNRTSLTDGLKGVPFFAAICYMVFLFAFFASGHRLSPQKHGPSFFFLIIGVSALMFFFEQVILGYSPPFISFGVCLMFNFWGNILFVLLFLFFAFLGLRSFSHKKDFVQ